jgi:hypothetical protein
LRLWEGLWNPPDTFLDPLALEVRAWGDWLPLASFAKFGLRKLCESFSPFSFRRLLEDLDCNFSF